MSHQPIWFKGANILLFVEHVTVIALGVDRHQVWVLGRNQPFELVTPGDRRKLERLVKDLTTKSEITVTSESIPETNE